MHLKDADLAAHRRVRDAGGGLAEVVAAGGFCALGTGDVDLAGVLARPRRDRLRRLAGDRAGRAGARAGTSTGSCADQHANRRWLDGGAAMTEAGKRIRIAVAGLGVIARTVHLPLLRRRADLFDIVALSDLSPIAAGRTRRPVRRRAGPAVHRTRRPCWPTGGCDAVLLATSGSHGDLAAAALRRGLPVLCEKPLAYTLAEADRLTGCRRRR